MLVVEVEKLPEDGGEEGEEAAVAEHLFFIFVIFLYLLFFYICFFFFIFVISFLYLL